MIITKWSFSQAHSSTWNFPCHVPTSPIFYLHTFWHIRLISLLCAWKKFHMQLMSQSTHLLYHTHIFPIYCFNLDFYLTDCQLIGMKLQNVRSGRFSFSPLHHKLNFFPNGFQWASASTLTVREKIFHTHIPYTHSQIFSWRYIPITWTSSTFSLHELCHLY